MKALILAAGYATRMYPITKVYPKPLLLVKRRPIINYIIDKLQKLDALDEIIVVTNSKFILRFKKWARGLESRKPITLVDDLTHTNSDRRGAVGDMDFAITKLRLHDDLLVIGGDNLFDGGLKDFLDFAESAGFPPVVGTYDVKDLSAASKYGVVRINQKRQIVDFKEKPKDPQSTLAAMCLYYFPKKTLGFIKEYLNHRHQMQDATGFYIDWLRKKIPVYAFTFGGRWYDIGDRYFYHQAKEKFNKV